MINLPILQTFHKITSTLQHIKQRFTALFLVALIAFGIVYPSAAVYAATHSTGPTASDILAKNPHKTSTTPSIGKINYKAPPAPTTSLKSKYTAATDATRLVGKGSALLNTLADKVNNEPLTN